MVNDMSRVLVETIVKKTLKDLHDSPERSIRNLVNMALDFSEGRFQRTFFTMAESMLENENSSYYALIRDLVEHVDSERILNFGMNLGYNSYTWGAKKIREKEAVCGYNIPWTISIRMDGQRLFQNPECYDSVIAQGKELGIYTWMLYQRGRLQDVLPLVRKHTDCAFILFCEPSEITLAFLDCIMDVKHLMLAVHYEETADDVYRQLRERELLYSVYDIYREKNVENILNGNLFYYAEQVHPLFTAVIPGADCTKEIGEEVYRAVMNFRKQQSYQTVLWDVCGDNNHIDSIISDDSCYVRFDADGNLYVRWKEKLPLNLFEQSLTDILKEAFPK